MRNPAFILAACLLSVTMPATAEIATCIGINDDLDRLACYDREAGRTPVATLVPMASDWTVKSEKSEFKDTTDVYMSVSSDEGVACGFRGERKISLFIRCRENTTSVFIATHCHLTSGHGGYGRVEYRIDENKAASSNMDASTDNSALGHWRGNSAIPFIKGLLGGNRLLVRFTPFSESPVTASFNIVGIDEAISPLREACNW